MKLAVCRPTRIVASMMLVAGSALMTTPAKASVLFDRLSPTGGANTVAITVTLQAQPHDAVSVVQAASFVDLDYDTDTHQLRIVDVDLSGSSVGFTLPSVTLAVTGLRVRFAPDSPGAQVPIVTIDPNTGAFTGLNVPVRFTGSVSVNGGQPRSAFGETSILLSGTLTHDAAAGSFALGDVAGSYGPLSLQITQSLAVQISGTTALDFDAPAPIDEIPGAARVGSPLILTGRGFTLGSVLKVFVATSSGIVDVIPNGLPPTTVAPDGTSGTWTLPWHWPVSPPNDVLLGSGYAAAALVRTDRNFSVSNSQGVVLLGNPGLNPKVPSITGIGAILLSPTSSQENIATANVEGLVVPGTTATIQGDGFASPVVNIFSASGNCAPPGGIVPGSSTATSITIAVPVSCPVGPGSLQAINATGSFLGSNAVSIPIGELITISGVSVNGNTVTVSGTGFNALTVINLFAASGGHVANAGGFAGNGAPNIPLSIVSSHQFTFTRPSGLDAGQAFVQAINPPFIPFTNSGASAAGSFTLP